MTTIAAQVDKIFIYDSFNQIWSYGIIFTTYV